MRNQEREIEFMASVKSPISTSIGLRNISGPPDPKPGKVVDSPFTVNLVFNHKGFAQPVWAAVALGKNQAATFWYAVPVEVGNDTTTKRYEAQINGLFPDFNVGSGDVYIDVYLAVLGRVAGTTFDVARDTQSANEKGADWETRIYNATKQIWEIDVAGTTYS